MTTITTFTEQTATAISQLVAKAPGGTGGGTWGGGTRQVCHVIITSSADSAGNYTATPTAYDTTTGTWASYTSALARSPNGEELTPGRRYDAIRYGVNADGVPVYVTDHWCCPSGLTHDWGWFSGYGCCPNVLVPGKICMRLQNGSGRAAALNGITVALVRQDIPDASWLCWSTPQTSIDGWRGWFTFDSTCSTGGTYRQTYVVQLYCCGLTGKYVGWIAEQCQTRLGPQPSNFNSNDSGCPQILQVGPFTADDTTVVVCDPWEVSFTSVGFNVGNDAETIDILFSGDCSEDETPTYDYRDCSCYYCVIPDGTAENAASTNTATLVISGVTSPSVNGTYTVPACRWGSDAWQCSGSFATGVYWSPTIPGGYNVTIKGSLLGITLDLGGSTAVNPTSMTCPEPLGDGGTHQTNVVFTFDLSAFFGDGTATLTIPCVGGP